MLNREARFNQSFESVARLTIYLQNSGFIVCPIGQERWLDSELHSKVMHVYGDKTVDFLRYFPDLSLWRNNTGVLLAQAKSTSPKYFNGQNFSIEQASLEVDKALYEYGLRVLIIFENKPNEFHCNWANLIKYYSI